MLAVKYTSRQFLGVCQYLLTAKINFGLTLTPRLTLLPETSNSAQLAVLGAVQTR